MLKSIITVSLAVVIGFGTLITTGCESDAGTGALIGTGLGAGVGAIAGRSTEATLIGAAVGGGAGYILGNEGDKKKTKQEIDSVRAEQNVVTVWITNTNGSKVPVKLRKDGPNFVGPRGEIYQRMPTEEELRMVYGF